MAKKTGISLRTAFAKLGIGAVLAATAVAAAACGSGGTPDAAATIPASPPPTVTPAVISTIKCHARATSLRVADHSLVGIRVRTVAHARLTALYDESLVAGQHPAGLASAKGKRTLWFRVTGAAPGSRVTIDVSVSRKDRTGACRAWFRLRPGPAATTPAPSVKPTAAPTWSPAPPPPATQAACFPLSNENTCYEPGEFCRDDDHGTRGVAGDGKSILCEDNDGWRWEPV
jgi:hypothetical protein